MEEASLDPLVAFSWLVSELLGRAVSACIDNSSVAVTANPIAYKKVTLELAQSPQRPGQILLKVSDEGYGLPDNLKAVKHAFAPLQRPLASSCLTQDAGLLLRTTNLQDRTIRRYHACSNTHATESSSATNTTTTTLEVVKVPIEEEKAPGMQISGTQATLIFSSLAVASDAALAACQQLLSMLSTLCPPVHLVLKAQDLLLVNNNDEVPKLLHQPQRQHEEESQRGSATSSATATATTITTATPLSANTAATTFARQLDPLPSVSLLSYTQRLKTGLLDEFPSSTNLPAANSASAQPPPPSPAPSALPLLSFVGVGEGAIPRGCKWNACAGVVLQLPDHDAITAAEAAAAEAVEAQRQYNEYNAHEERREESENSARGGNPPTSTTPAYLFKSHAVQFADNANYVDALHRVNWAGYGFKLLNASSGSTSSPTLGAAGGEAEEASVEPVAVLLQCEQPESMASIAAIVVHLYYCAAGSTTQVPTGTQATQIDNNSIMNTNTSQQQEQQQRQQIKRPVPLSSVQLPKLAPLHQRTLIRSAIEAALSDLKQQCPSVISDRRDRSLTRALPVVSTAVAGILNRAVDERVLVEACQALRVREVSGLADALHRRLEEVVVYAQQQQQQRLGEESASGA